MHLQIQKICERADLEEIRKINPRILPIKDMLFFLETKWEDYAFLLSTDSGISTEIYYMQQKTMNCISYLKKIQ
jgi:hypothetical protein